MPASSSVPPPLNRPESSLPRPVSPRAPSPWRFSLRTLLIVITVVALAIPLIALSGGEILWSTFHMTAVVGLGTAAIYSRGRRQTFFGGACAAAVITAVQHDVYSRDPIDALVAWVLGGMVAAIVRRFVENRGWHQPATSSDRHDDSKNGLAN